MKLAELMPLRAACEVFLATCQDEVSGDVISESLLSGQVERVLCEAYTLFMAGVTDIDQCGADPWTLGRVRQLLLLLGIEIKKTKKKST